VILISIDTLRAGHLGVYGYRKIPTPNIDAFARHGTVFESIDSQLPLTLPSHTTLFTSTYPFEHGVEENGQRVPAGAVTLASVLRSHGYKTAAFVGSVLMDRSLGLDRGFDFYDSPFRASSEESGNPYAVGVRRDGALVLRAARQWLGENRNQPVFAFIHLYDLHAPYSQAPSRGGLPNAAGYDAQLAYVDRLLGQFQQALMQGGWWERSLVVLLSDHGESLGDHGESGHGYFMYQSTLLVPLIVHWPGGVSTYADRAGQPGGLIDVAPTILDFLKLPAPATFHGASLLAAARTPKDDGRAVYSESLYPHDAFHWAPLRGIRVGGYQYIDAPKPELYYLPGDPAELHNVIAQNAEMARTLRGRLASLLAQYAARRPASTGDASPQSRRTLESLGYVGRGPDAAGSGADPKDRLAEYNLYEKALAAMYSGDPSAAVADFQQLLARDPHNSLARYYLGDAYVRARQPESAIREWTSALRFDPTYVPAAEALGALWIGRQDYAKAREAFQKALAIAPGDAVALLGLGTAEEHLGLLPDALQHLESACKAMPDSASCNRELQAVKEKMK
jgi:arylsulfatase A-like enzyme/thioredoxin-like negative regulator of GroEL